MAAQLCKLPSALHRPVCWQCLTPGENFQPLHQVLVDASLAGIFPKVETAATYGTAIQQADLAKPYEWLLTQAIGRH